MRYSTTNPAVKYGSKFIVKTEPWFSRWPTLDWEFPPRTCPIFLIGFTAPTNHVLPATPGLASQFPRRSSRRTVARLKFPAERTPEQLLPSGCRNHRGLDVAHPQTALLRHRGKAVNDGV